MRIGVIGRSKPLIDSARLLLRNGHQIAFIYTCRTENYYNYGVEHYEKFAKEINVPFYCDLAINKYLKDLSHHGAEICISLNWMTLLQDDLLKLFPKGVLNAHGGDLPRYRGNACINWAILNKEKESCMAIHQMIPELDAGPVYLKRFFPLTEDTYVGDYYDWANSVVPEMFLESIKMISKGISPSPQDDQILPLRCFPRKKEDSQINWKSNVHDVHALVRASSHPFDGAFCYTDKGKCLKIFRSSIFRPPYEFFAVPGQICFMEGGVTYVACTNSDLLLGLVDVSLEGLGHCESLKVITSSMRNRLFSPLGNQIDSGTNSLN